MSRFLDLKLDNCRSCPNESYATALQHYSAMGAALNATGRPIFYMSEFGTEYGLPPGGHAGPHVGPGNDSLVAPSIFNTDRIGGDIQCNWKSVMSLVDDDIPHQPFASPGFFNDVEMLEVGNGMTVTEDESHFAMWCVLAAPLIVGCDMTTMSHDTLRILTNPGAIAIDQDPLGVQGVICHEDNSTSVQVWRRPLHDGSIAVVAINRNNNASKDIFVDFSECGHGGSLDHSGESTTTVHDVWTGNVLGNFGASYTALQVPSHGHAFLTLTKNPGAQARRVAGTPSPAISRSNSEPRRCITSRSSVERIGLACALHLRIAGIRAHWGSANDWEHGCDDPSSTVHEADMPVLSLVSNERLGRQSCSFLASARAFGATQTPRLMLSYECV
jgi:alpha-galactosidase